MVQVLILTKDFLADIQLQQSLQNLNFEVFSSCSMVEKIQRNLDISDFLRFFQIVILSESLSESDLALIIPYLLNQDVFIVRRDHEEPDEEKRVQWQNLGIDTWLVPEDSPTSIREKLLAPLYRRNLDNGRSESFSIVAEPVELYDSYSTPRLVSYDQKLPPNFLQKLQDNLSDQETEIFVRLLARENIPLTREEICSVLWPGAEVEQKLAQISIIIRNMKAKFLEFGFKGNTLRTRRGVGYVLCQEFYRLLMEAGADHFFLENKFIV